MVVPGPETTQYTGVPGDKQLIVDIGTGFSSFSFRIRKAIRKVITETRTSHYNLSE